MKRRMSLSMPLVLGLSLLLLVSSNSMAQTPEENSRFVADSGVITLGPNQILRLTINAGAGNDTISVQFKRLSYSQGVCNGGDCFLTTQPAGPTYFQLTSNEGATINIPNTSFGVRGVFLCDSPNVRVTAQIINTVTGKTVAAWIEQVYRD